MKSFAKYLSALTILALLSSNLVAFAEFSDLSPDHPYYTEMTKLNEQGCLKGYEDGTIKPDQLINRVETLKLMLTCLDLPGIYQEETFILPPKSTYTINDSETKVEEETTVKLKVPIDFNKQTPLDYSDVDDDAWYAPILKEALIRKLVTGYVDGTIKPTKTITKAEFFTILHRLVPTEFQTTTLSELIASDVPNDSWFADGMSFGIKNGLINLGDDQESNAMVELNRGHVAFFLVHYSEWLDGKLNPSTEETDNEEDTDSSDENLSDENTETSESSDTADETTDTDTTEENEDETETSNTTDTASTDPAQYVLGYSETGQASYYGENFTGHTTASGDLHNPSELVAAHKTIPFNTIVKVTNLDTGLWVKVRINDRGPYVEGRIIDLSYSAFDAIASPSAGVANVQIEIVE